MVLDPELAEIQLERMNGELAQARIELADAERLSTEGRTLATRGAFPQSEADSRETAVEVKRATVRQLEARTKQQRAIIERHHLVALDSPRLDVQVPQEYFAKLAGESKVTADGPSPLRETWCSGNL